MYNNNVKNPSKKKQSSRFFDKYVFSGRFQQNYLFQVSDPKSIRSLKRDINNLLAKDIVKGTVNYEKTQQYFTPTFIEILYNVVFEELNHRIMLSSVFNTFYEQNPAVNDRQRIKNACDEYNRSLAAYHIFYDGVAGFYSCLVNNRVINFDYLKAIPTKFKSGGDVNLI